ncbi:hypothetical protein [Variovorax sp. GT1P44]|uniref:hypothetical protein n=1 Tax=Variovorax sp. GT1P44 TaxID=3443742 RepID=UPI003F45A5EF
MPNAPVLSGTAGSLVALLDACLKDGFNTITPTSIVVAGGIATVTWPSGTFAALKDAVVLIAGVTDKVALNGEQKVLTKNALSLTFATAESNGTATLSSPTMKMAPMGWLKPFTGTNLAAYLSNDPASTKMLLRVDDTGTTSARVVGYESMSDVNTGVGAFPTAAQTPGGGYWAKSQVANSTAVQWSLVGDGRTFYINIQSGSGVSPLNQITAGRMFGDVAPLKPGGDAYACTLNYSSSASVSTQYDGATGGTGVAQFALPREYSGLGSAVLASAYVYGNLSTQNSGITSTLGVFPSPVDGSLLLATKYLTAPATGTTVPRANLPGIYSGLQSGLWNSFKLGDRTPGAGALAGRNLAAATSNDASTALNSASTSSNTGIVFFDVTGPWR